MDRAPASFRDKKLSRYFAVLLVAFLTNCFVQKWLLLLLCADVFSMKYTLCNTL